MTMAVTNWRSTTKWKQYSITFVRFVCIAFLFAGVLLSEQLHVDREAYASFALLAHPEARTQLPPVHTPMVNSALASHKPMASTVLAPLLQRDGGFCLATACPSGMNAIRLAWTQAPDAPDSVESNTLNKWAKVVVTDTNTFQMLTRDKKADSFISGTIQSGGQFDAHVRNLIIQQLFNKTAPVFIDIGANIGYMSSTALALGATVISFEPFWENAGIFMSTVRKNGWKDRSHLYLNALSYESVRVSMESTNEKTNLSNMHITASQCTDPLENKNSLGTYGLNYMEAVSLDQVMLTQHPGVAKVDIIKIDVETHEMHVINGAMHFLCNRVVNMIVMEVEYLKPGYNPKGTPCCDFATMWDRMEQMGFSLWDCSLKQDYTDKQLNSLPGDVVFVQKYQGEPPARRLKGTENNPCESFEL
jgi:FkbM family methyltransferase